MNRLPRLFLTATLLAVAMPSTLPAVEAAGPTRTSLDTASPREAGTRYGQAAGVALVCYGMRTTPAAETLKARFTGPDQSAFQEEAEKVLAAWRELHACRRATGPNECRLSHAWSCRDAMREIGPAGSALPGLVEAK